MKKDDGPGWTDFGRILRSLTNSERGHSSIGWEEKISTIPSLPSREECDRQLPIRAEHTNYGEKI